MDLVLYNFFCFGQACSGHVAASLPIGSAAGGAGCAIFFSSAPAVRENLQRAAAVLEVWSGGRG